MFSPSHASACLGVVAVRSVVLRRNLTVMRKSAVFSAVAQGHRQGEWQCRGHICHPLVILGVAIKPSLLWPLHSAIAGTLGKWSLSPFLIYEMETKLTSCFLSRVVLRENGMFLLAKRC